MSIEFVEGRFSDGIRLNGSNLFIPLGLGSNYTFYLYRKLETDTEWTQIIKLSNGDQYINGSLNESYDTSWLTIDGNGDLTISSTAEEIDELLVLNSLATETQLNEWTIIERPFYDVLENLNVIKPSNVSLEVS